MTRPMMERPTPRSSPSIRRSPGSLVIVGASGHGKVVADVAQEAGFELRGFLDRAPGREGCGGTPVLGTEDDLPGLLERFDALQVVVAVGDNGSRRRVVERLSRASPTVSFASLVHPRATVATDVELGPGSVVMAGAVINPGTRVGAHCIVNTGAIVDHDGLLGDYSTVSPAACLGGNVVVGKGAMIGLGASVIHGIRIGDHTVLGAGAVAVRDIGDLVVAVGVPARVLRLRREDEPYL